MQKTLKLLLAGLLVLFFNVNLHAQTFKNIGTPTSTEGGHTIIPAPTAGNFIIGGHHDNEAMISEINSSGIVQWTYTFDVKSGEIDRILDLRIDSDGRLIGCGSSSDSKYRRDGFAFRFNLSTSSLDWVYETNGSQSTSNGEDFQCREIHDLPGTTEVLLINTVRDYAATDNKTNAGILKLNRTTGAVIANSAIQYSNTATNNQDDNFNGSVLIGSQLYIVGRANLDDPNGLKYSRMIYAQIDIGAMGSTAVDGNYGHVDQTNFYITALTTNVTEYGSSIVVQNSGDDIALLGHGGYNNGGGFSNSTNTNMHLVTQSLTTGSHTFYKIDIPGTVRVQTFQLLETVDGYIICAIDLTAADKYYMIRLEENGSGGYSTMWAKSYSGITSPKLISSNNQTALIDGSFIYMIGDAMVGGSRDVVLVKADLATGDIIIGSTSCANDITTTITSGTYMSTFSYGDPGDVYTHNNPNVSAASATFTDDDICATSDPCDYDVTALANPVTPCSYQFFANVSGGAGPFAYHWDFGDGTTSTDANPTHRYLVAAPPQNFTITLTVYSYYFDGAQFVCCSNSDQINIVIDERCDPCPDDVNFSYKSICCGVFEFNALEAVGLTALFWDFGDGSTASGNPVTHDYGTTAGSYTVTLTAMYYDGDECCIVQKTEAIQYDCSDGTPVLGDMSTTKGREEVKDLTLSNGTEMSDGITLYPNPTTGHVSIAHGADVHTITVVDHVGRELMKIHPQNQEQTQLNLAELKNGMYIVILSGNHTKTSQVIKE